MNDLALTDSDLPREGDPLRGRDLLHDKDLLRYSRHILLNEFGIEAQEKLSQSRALVVGAGGLGSAALLYLATAGIGRITVADGDTVELSNLQRQIVHREAAIGINKAESAVTTLHGINTSIALKAIAERLSPAELITQVANADVVLDCTDNFATRHAINRACVANRKPLVSGAAVRFDGQVTLFDLRRDDSPCYHCLFPESGESEDLRCAVMGIFAPLTGIVGTIQAAETLKLLLGIGDNLNGRLLLIDGLGAEWRAIRLARDPACPVCAAR